MTVYVLNSFFNTFNMFVGKKHNLNYNSVCVVRLGANAEPRGGGEDDPTPRAPGLKSAV